VIPWSSEFGAGLTTLPCGTMQDKLAGGVAPWAVMTP